MLIIPWKSPAKEDENYNLRAKEATESLRYESWRGGGGKTPQDMGRQK